jgi:DNA-binding beta-propeller fold protein YncE
MPTAPIRRRHALGDRYHHHSITATLDVLGYPEAVAVSADGERVYVGDYWSRAVAVISVPMLRDQLGNT